MVYNNVDEELNCLLFSIVEIGLPTHAGLTPTPSISFLHHLPDPLVTEIVIDNLGKEWRCILYRALIIRLLFVE